MLHGLFLKSLSVFSAVATFGLGAPTATLTSGESQVFINWVAPTQPINGVDIEESKDAGNTWGTYLKMPPTSTHVRIQGLLDGKDYYFRVRWIWPDNSLGIPSKTLVAIPINIPTQPTGLVATASSSEVALQWDQTTQSSVIGYDIEQSTNGGNSWTVLTSNSGSPSSGYLINNLIAGTTYTYRIKALSFGGGQSDYSDAAVVKIASAPTGGFTLNYKITLGKITLTWDTPTDLPDIASYEVQVSGDGGLNWFKVVTTQGTINTAAVPYVIGGSTYQVIATSSLGATSNSAIQLIQTNALADPRTSPTLKAVVGTNPSPTPSSTSTSAPSTPSVPKSSRHVIIPIILGLITLGISGLIVIGVRSRDSRKRPRKRRKRKPVKNRKSRKP